MASRLEIPGKDAKGEDRFVGFMQRLVQVPHSEIKEKLDAEREAKRTSKTSVSRVAGALPKNRA